MKTILGLETLIFENVAEKSVCYRRNSYRCFSYDVPTARTRKRIQIEYHYDRNSFLWQRQIDKKKKQNKLLID